MRLVPRTGVPGASLKWKSKLSRPELVCSFLQKFYAWEFRVSFGIQRGTDAR